MGVDLLIENGRIVVPKSGIFNVCLAITGGTIVGLYESADGISAEEKIDARGNYILPGLLEPHAHYGYLRTFEEDFQSETASAAIGGVTTVIPFYRDYRAQASLYENFPAQKQLAEKNAYIDFSFHFGIINPSQLMQVEKYINEYGIPSFKFYMAYKGEEAMSTGMMGNETDDGFLLDAFSALARFPGAVACVHAENIEIILNLIKKYRAAGKDGLPVWSECRPNLSEAESVQRAILFAEAVGCPIYIVHLSTKEALEVVRQFKVRYPKIYVETCPHYLTLTQNSPLGTLGKVNPPLRGPEDIDALWKGIAEGMVDTIGTDHCANSKASKAGSIWDARPGFPGTATMLPVLLSEGVNRKKISLERVAEVTAFNTAKIFNLFPRKGTIQVGSDADLCIVDLNESKKVDPQMLKSGSDFSLYDGWTLTGWPMMTIVRGKVVMKDGDIAGSKGHGSFIVPSA